MRLAGGSASTWEEEGARTHLMLADQVGMLLSQPAQQEELHANIHQLGRFFRSLRHLRVFRGHEKDDVDAVRSGTRFASPSEPSHPLEAPLAKVSILLLIFCSEVDEFLLLLLVVLHGGARGCVRKGV